MPRYFILKERVQYIDNPYTSVIHTSEVPPIDLILDAKERSYIKAKPFRLLH